MVPELSGKVFFSTNKFLLLNMVPELYQYGVVT